MPWTQEMHDAAQGRLNGIAQEYQTAVTAWQNGIQAGNPAQYEAQIQDILRRWRQLTNDLRAQSETAIANQGVMDKLGKLVGELGDQQQVLARLQSEATTRADQADSLNPKVRPSPYTNILGLQRTFRESTRTVIFWIAIALGALTLVGVGWMGYQIYVQYTKKGAASSYGFSSSPTLTPTPAR